MKTKASILFANIALTSSDILAEMGEKRFGFEIRGGASIALSKPGDATLNPGFGFEGILHYRFMPHTGVYGGWGWNRYSDRS